MSEFAINLIEKKYSVNLIEKKYAVNMQAVTVISELNQVDGGVTGHIEAGEIINGNKAIYMKDGKAYLASLTNPECYNKIIGISKNAVVAGEVVNFKSAGTLNGFGGLVQNKLYYLGVNGDLSPTAPAYGIFQIIGIAKTNEELFIDISIPIQRI